MMVDATYLGGSSTAYGPSMIQGARVPDLQNQGRHEHKSVRDLQQPREPNKLV